MGVRLSVISMMLMLTLVLTTVAGDLDRRLAVLPFDGKMIEDDYAETLSSLLRMELGRIEGYDVIDRGNMEMILKEQQVQLHDCTESACAVRFGEILNVRWIIVGSLSRFGQKYLFMTSRVDVQTGRIVNTSQFETRTLEQMTDSIPVAVRELLGMETSAGRTGAIIESNTESGSHAELPGIPPVDNQSGDSGYAVPPPVIRRGSEPPTIEWISQPPRTMSLKDGKQVKFKFRGNDDRCIEVYHYRFDDEPMAESRRGQVVLKNVGEGNHTFQVMVEDCDGNVSSPLRCDFAVRNMPPEVTIWSPKKNETVRAKKLTVRLAGLDDDGEIKRYRCAVNNPSNAREQTSPDFTFDVADGPVVIYAQVVDDAGLESAWVEQRVVFQYAADPTPTPTPEPVDWDNTRRGAVTTVDLGGGVTIDMVYLKGDTFRMGSPVNERGRFDDEGPVHSVVLNGFWIGKYEITQAQYEQVMNTNPSHFKGSNRPVESVTWNDAMEFCRKLSSRTGQMFTLPTEAQWEYACRAGTTGPFSFGNCLSSSDANYDGKHPLDGCSKGSDRKSTWDVGSGRANTWGIFDMHGNVWEWCKDFYEKDYYSPSTRRNPRGPVSGSGRVFRGGSHGYQATLCRSANRGWNSPRISKFYLGFRVVRSD